MCMHIDIGASKDKKKKRKKKDGYTTNCIKNEAEHITDDMVTKRVTAYIRKNEKDHKDTDIINKNRNIGAALSDDRKTEVSADKHLMVSVLISEPKRRHCTF
jgi:hypothetical protein